MVKSEIKIFKDKFYDKENDVEVEATTIIIDGMLNDALELIIENNDKYQDKEELIFDALLKGLNRIKEETFDLH